MLSLHGLGLCYLLKGSAAACDTASAYLELALEDTASAYLSFARQAYREYGQGLALIERLLPYGLYWAGVADIQRGDGWGALADFEKLYLNYPESRFWDEAAVRYSALQMQRGELDSARAAAESLLERTTDLHRALEARLILASVLSRRGRYRDAAVGFASLSRALAVGDTLRVLAHAGMVGSLLRVTETIAEADSIPGRLARLELSGYNPLAIPQVNIQIAVRFLAERRLTEAADFFRRSLRYYPDPWAETQARLGLAWIALAEGDWDASIEHYERALKLVDRYRISFSGLADVRFNVGLAYLERWRSSPDAGDADLERARSSFREALALDPAGETGELARKRLQSMD